MLEIAGEEPDGATWYRVTLALLYMYNYKLSIVVAGHPANNEVTVAFATS